MTMLLVVYEAGIDEDLSGILEEVGVAAYTKLTGATGTGHRGNRFGTQIWPGTNNLLWIALSDAAVPGVVRRLQDLKESYVKPPALQIFTLPVQLLE